MRILLIRHAEPDYSVDSLTEKGFREAELLSERLVKESIDDFYVSPLGRAQDTIRPTLQKLHLTAETLPWLAEFRGYVYGPEGRRIPWNLAPQYWTKQPLLFEKDGWTREALMATGNCEEIYRETVEGLDALLARYGLTRDGMLYLCEKNPDVTIALTCHCALSLTLVAALTGIAAPLMWHGFCLPPSSVTELVAEERIPGQLWFRVSFMGDTSHLYVAGEPISSCALFYPAHGSTVR